MRQLLRMSEPPPEFEPGFPEGWRFEELLAMLSNGYSQHIFGVNWLVTEVIDERPNPFENE